MRRIIHRYRRWRIARLSAALAAEASRLGRTTSKRCGELRGSIAWHRSLLGLPEVTVLSPGSTTLLLASNIQKPPARPSA